ncbi:hypothetical protein BHK69_01025 [Bosea vaviloviae]|uniref:Uncharacterized protein n=1 Tax=Bosea vaviloviae TaxID=1526658 RepID=A0A1D7TVW8_9HYPH|nr:hypothetical protein BHK69_01025 [Bosea vaviloviae]
MVNRHRWVVADFPFSKYPPLLLTLRLKNEKILGVVMERVGLPPRERNKYIHDNMAAEILPHF